MSVATLSRTSKGLRDVHGRGMNVQSDVGSKENQHWSRADARLCYLRSISFPQTQKNMTFVHFIFILSVP